MESVSTTRLSSKGQVVIPEEVRNNLHFKEGDQFIVIGRGDTVILKTLTPPSFDEFTDLLNDAQVQAKKAGLKKRDIINAIKKVRSRKRK